MHKEVTARQIMFRSVLRFCGKPEFVLPSGGQELVAILQDLSRTIEYLGREQLTGSGQSSASVASRLETARVLRNVLRQITNVAHRLDPVQWPGIAEQFQMPV